MAKNMNSISNLTEALEQGWKGIQKRHPEIPDVVVVVGPVSLSRGKADRYGHYAPGRWDVQGNRRHEVLISAEGLNRGARQIFRTLLHESVHASCAARGLKDTSRGGRYHNGTFKAEAESFGLETDQDSVIGCVTPNITDAAASEFSKEIARIESALTLFRREELDDEILEFAYFLLALLRWLGHDVDGRLAVSMVPVRKRQKSAAAGNNPVKASCGCGRSIRVFPSVLAEAPITCGNCGEEFS